MKLQLLVIGCCVALAISKPAEDACAAMRARLLPSLEPSARADAGALRACDADSDGAVDAAELVSCVQRAFGSTAHMDRAEVGERIHCFRSIMTDTALRGEQRQMIDTEQVRQLGSGSGRVSELECEGQNQLVQIMAAIADGQLQAAYDALLEWYIGALSPSAGLLNGLLNNVVFILQFLLSGRSSESLVYILTAFVRSANNALTAPVEDALISSLLAVSVGNFAAARIVIKLRLNDDDLDPATQDELQWIIDAFDAGSTEDAVTRIVSLLAGCPTSGAQPTCDALSGDSIYSQLLKVYDVMHANPIAERYEYSVFWNQTQNRQPPLNEEDREYFENVAEVYKTLNIYPATIKVLEFLTRPCDFDTKFWSGVISVLRKFEYNIPRVSIELSKVIENPTFTDNPKYEEALSQLQAALDSANNSDYDGALKEIRKVVVTCICKAEMMDE